jgi:hypothetical protein
MESKARQKALDVAAINDGEKFLRSLSDRSQFRGNIEEESIGMG